MERHKIEFSIGDQVTFNANGTPCKTIVKGVDVDVLCGGKDERIFYWLEGWRTISNLKTSGLCIQESIYFEKPDGEIPKHVRQLMEVGKWD